MTTTKMKGLLKGLRYISQIFDNEKEPEMQIGYPTDVKHVAHIGMDGPSAHSPSWMNEFQTSREPSSGLQNYNGDAKDNPTTKSSTKDILKSSGPPLDSPTRRSSKSKQSRRHTSSNGSLDSPTRDPLGSTKPRRHKNSDLDSPTRDSSHRPRRLQNSSLGSDSPSQDPPGVSKKSQRKKTKGSSGGGSTRLRSKGPDPLIQNFPYSDPGTGYVLKNNEIGTNSGLKVFEEGKECDEISRGIGAL